MFEQTFVEVAGKTKKPYLIVLSSVVQVLTVAVLILVPLVYTQVLPNAQLRSVLAAPAPPAPPMTKTPHPLRAERTVAARIFNAGRLVSPTVIPQRINDVREAPGIASADGIGEPHGAPDGVAASILDAIGSAPPAPVPMHKAAAAPTPVGGKVLEANLIHRVQPVYPALAKTTHVQGTVEFTAIISKEGTVERLQLVRGHPLLISAAREAILQWRYRPTMLNGEAVEVITDIVVNFTLSQ